MKLLINLPALHLVGGVANHYKGLQPYWTADVIYNFVGKRNCIPRLFILFYDYLKFLVLCLVNKNVIVVLNPSLDRKAFLRDALFLKIAKILGRKVVVFFHGWSCEEECLIDKHPRRFKTMYGNSDAFIVLSKRFSKKIHSWGVDAPVYLSSTKVDDRLVDGFDVKEKKYGENLLFLARVELNKGILISIEAFSKVRSKLPNAKLIVAGSGDALSFAQDYVRSESIDNVYFLGNLSGDELKEAFREADIYILPTTHGEGMPTSVLEAMMFGLPVITRPVGGLRDFFEDKKMGFMSERVDPEWYARVITELMSDNRRMVEIGLYNHNYAKERFLASKVASQLEGIFRIIV